ncbi:MAG: hypothetical protein MUQ10_01150 [Anaerolineae bacterium]|nr:hypothetical protein [Anaerolineae bacterium]
MTDKPLSVLRERARRTWLLVVAGLAVVAVLCVVAAIIAAGEYGSGGSGGTRHRRDGYAAGTRDRRDGDTGGTRRCSLAGAFGRDAQRGLGAGDC